MANYNHAEADQAASTLSRRSTHNTPLTLLSVEFHGIQGCDDEGVVEALVEAYVAVEQPYNLLANLKPPYKFVLPRLGAFSPPTEKTKKVLLQVACSAPKLSNLPDLQKSSDVSDEGGDSINCS
jgi:hypothetical protein